MLFDSPGSIDQFSQTLALDPSGEKAIREYSQALIAYRLGLAATQGISVEELHQQPVLPRADLKSRINQAYNND